MDYVVFDFAFAGQVGVEHLPDRRGAVREADVLDAVAAGEKVFDEKGTLCGFAAAVEAFEDEQFAALGGVGGCWGGEGLGGEAVRALLGSASWGYGGSVDGVLELAWGVA